MQQCEDPCERHFTQDPWCTLHWRTVLLANSQQRVRMPLTLVQGLPTDIVISAGHVLNSDPPIAAALFYQAPVVPAVIYPDAHHTVYDADESFSIPKRLEPYAHIPIRCVLVTVLPEDGAVIFKVTMNFRAEVFLLGTVLTCHGGEWRGEIKLTEEERLRADEIVAVVRNMADHWQQWGVKHDDDLDDYEQGAAVGGATLFIYDFVQQ